MSPKLQLRIMHKAYLLVTVSIVPLIIAIILDLKVLHEANPEGTAIPRLSSWIAVAFSFLFGYPCAYFFASGLTARIRKMEHCIEQVKLGQPINAIKNFGLPDELSELEKSINDLIDTNIQKK